MINETAEMRIDILRNRVAELETVLQYVVDNWTSQFERNGHLAPEWCKRARAALQSTGENEK